MATSTGITTGTRCFKDVDRLMQDLKQSMELFGGVTTVLGGDFAQILPAVKQGNNFDIIEASLQLSYCSGEAFASMIKIGKASLRE